MRLPGGDWLSPFDRLVWPEGVIEHLLATGERRRELLAYLGEEEYLALRPLAVAAAASRKDPERCVYLIPGIMGSQLGLPRAAPLPANLLWLDPEDFQQGHLSLLALPGPPIQPLGPVLYSYLPLKLALEALGYTLRYFDYDWRLDLDQLGAALAERLRGEPARDISLIGHSMGGLIGHVALGRAGGEKARRLITLGTPHTGSFAPLQALRGVYPLVRRVAQLDPRHSAEQLASQVFSTFPSLYQMLPAQAGSLDLFDVRNWPGDGPQPDVSLLANASKRQPGAIDGRITCIAGHSRETVGDASRSDTEFRYHVDGNGDGTVPADRAVLAGAGAWYCPVGHSDLPRHPRIHAALIRLLADETPDLAAVAPRDPLARRTYTDSDLRSQLNHKIDWSRLDPAARRHFLDSLNDSTLPEALARIEP